MIAFPGRTAFRWWKFFQLLLNAAKTAEPHLGREAVAGILLAVTWVYITRQHSPEEASAFLRDQIAKLQAGADSVPQRLERT